MTKYLSGFLLFISLIQSGALLAQSYFGITPDGKYGLPNNIGQYVGETGKISTCISVPNNGQPLGVSFQIQLSNPPTIGLVESRPFNESKLKTAAGEEPACSGSFDSATLLYQDIIQIGAIPHYVAFKLIDETQAKFQLTDFLMITEEADIAFVLRGYNGTTKFSFPASFRGDAKLALEGLSKLSFGKINSYRIFDGGVDQDGPDYYQSLEDLKTVDAALSDWTGSPWSSFKERDASSGAILINPTAEEITVLNSLKQWLISNRKGASAGWQETELGRVHFDAWVRDKVLRYGGTAASTFLRGFQLPKNLAEQSFKTIGIAFSSTDQFNTSGLQSSCSFFGITNSDGQEMDDSHTCFYSDYSDPNPGLTTAEALMAANARTTIHEVIHGLGHGGHDRDESGAYFPYSVMNQGKVDQYPIWNRIYIMDWLTESAITDDPNLVVDSYGASDPDAKYLLRLGPANDFDCQNEFGVAVTCHRYQELYNGNWVQYKTDYTVGGFSFFKGGVKFEPLSDVSDQTSPKVVAPNNNAAQVLVTEEEQKMKIEFDESINLGTGSIVVTQANGSRLGAYQTNRLPETSSEDLAISGRFLTIKAYQVNAVDGSTAGFRINSGQSYTVAFSDGAITDRAGNSVDQNSYSFSR